MEEDVKILLIWMENRMKIRISAHGNLEIYRKNQWLIQLCPKNSRRTCGDHCPFFGEVEKHADGLMCLQICETTFVEDKIIDNRKEVSK